MTSLSADSKIVLVVADVATENNNPTEAEGNQMFEVNAIVRFANPTTDAEVAETFKVLEPRGDRVLVEAVCNLTIKPTFVYLVADLVDLRGSYRVASNQFGYEMFVCSGLGVEQWTDQEPEAYVYSNRDDNRKLKLAYWKAIAKHHGLDSNCVRIVEVA